MNGIQKQNTRQAMDILKSATDNKWDVRVSKNGNVRIASWVDRFKSEFTAFINPSRTRTNWVEKAELAIFEKLKGEISLLKGNAVKANNLQSLINNIKNENNQALKKISINSGILMIEISMD